MNATANLLSQMVAQYQARHQRLPDAIHVHPAALAALVVKGTVAPRWNGIPVKCLEVAPVERPTERILGISLWQGALRSFDL